MKNRSKLWLIIGAGLAIGGLLRFLFAPKKSCCNKNEDSGRGKRLTRDKKDKFLVDSRKAKLPGEEFEPKLFIETEPTGEMD